MGRFDVSMYRQNPLRSVADYENDYLNADIKRQGLMVNKLKFDEYQRGLADDAAWESQRNAFDLNTPEGQAAAVRANPARALPLVGKVAEVEGKRAATAKVDQDLAMSRYGEWRKTMGALADDPALSKEKAIAAGQALVANGIIPEAMFLASVEKMPDDPAQLRLGFKQGALAQMSPEKILEFFAPKPVARDSGQVIQTFDENPNSPTYGKPTGMPPLQKVQDPNNVATNARIAADNAASRAVTMRGQDLVDARTRELAALRQQEVDAGKIGVADAKKQGELDKKVTQFAATIEKHGIPEFESALSDLEAQLGKYPKGKAPGVGRVVGLVPDWLQGQDAEDMSRAIASVKNVLLKTRSGAAVTESELRRFVNEMGVGGFRSEESVRKAIASVRKRFDTVKQNTVAGVSDDVKSTYEERGGISLKRGAPEIEVATEAAPAGVDPKDWKHMTPQERKLWKKP